MARRRYWLVKSEPDVFSFDDLWKAKGRTTHWDGVRNYQARNLMRDEMKLGDGVLYYHSNSKPPHLAGLAEVAREGYVDFTQFDPKDGHYDPKADPDNPRWYMVDVRAVEKLPAPIGLPELKANPKLSEMMLCQKGSRLSVQPVSAGHWKAVLAMAGLK